MSTPHRRKKGPAAGSHAGPESNTEPTTNASAVPSLSGRWFSVAVAPLDRLKHNQTGAIFSVLLAIWIVLLRESHFRRSNTIHLSDAILAERAGITRRTVIRYRHDLVATGLVTVAEPKRDRTTGRYHPTTWILNPTVPAFRPPRSDTKSPGPSDTESPRPSDTESTTQSHRLLQSSPGGFPSQAALGEETVEVGKNTGGDATRSPRGVRLEAATTSAASPGEKEDEGTRPPSPLSWREVALANRRQPKGRRP